MLVVSNFPIAAAFVVVAVVVADYLTLIKIPFQFIFKYLSIKKSHISLFFALFFFGVGHHPYGSSHSIEFLVTRYDNSVN